MTSDSLTERNNLFKTFHEKSENIFSFYTHNHVRFIACGCSCCSYLVFTSLFEFQISGGGGGGGRIAIYSTESYRYTGLHTTYGGKSVQEYGGPGTVYTHQVVANGTDTHLYISNMGYKPKHVYIDDISRDSGRAYLVNDDIRRDLFHFNHFTLLGGSHVVTVDQTLKNIPVTFDHIHGDLTGFLHAYGNQHITIKQSDQPFPIGFRIYPTSTLSLPAGM